MSRVNLDLATRICFGVVNKCKEMGWAPVSVVVVDSCNHAIASMRMDNCSPVAYPKFAIAKANTAVSLGMSSRKFRDKYASDPNKLAQMQSMISIMDGKLAGFPGSVLMLSPSGSIAGAVGVSGASSDQDEYLALHAVKDSGFEGITEPASSPLDT